MILMFLFCLFSTQTPSDISQSGTCGTGCKSSGLGRGTVDVSVVVSATACLHNPSGHGRHGKVSDDTYQHEDHIYRIGVVQRIVRIVLELQDVVLQHKYLNLGQHTAEKVTHGKPQIDGNVTCEPLAERGLETVPHAEGKGNGTEDGQYHQKKGPYRIYQQGCRSKKQFQQTAESVTDILFQIVHAHFLYMPIRVAMASGDHPSSSS